MTIILTGSPGGPGGPISPFKKIVSKKIKKQIQFVPQVEQKIKVSYHTTSNEILRALMAVQIKTLFNFTINFLVHDFYYGNLRNYKTTYRL